MDNPPTTLAASVAWRACACRPANDSSAIPLTTHQSHGNYFHYFPTETATCFEYIKRVRHLVSRGRHSVFEASISSVLTDETQRRTEQARAEAANGAHAKAVRVPVKMPSERFSYTSRARQQATR